METIALNDGTVLNARCFPEATYLYLYIYDLPVKEGLFLFLDPEKTNHIVHTAYENEYVYDGYTEIYSFNNSAGNFNIVLRKGEPDAAA